MSSIYVKAHTIKQAWNRRHRYGLSKPYRTHSLDFNTWCQKCQKCAMDKLEPPGVLSLTGNVAENWKKFKQRFDVYMTATGASEKGDKQKACIFLHVVGEEAVQVYNTFVFDDGDEYKLKKILEKFEAYCTPKRNTTYERHKFFTRVQRSDETIDQYVTELRTMAKNSEFGE